MITIKPIRAFQDNYIWLLTEEGTGQAAVVDPGDDAVVATYLKKHDLKLVSILVTHHHFDHTGGVEGLRRYSPDLCVYGPAANQTFAVDVSLADQDRIELFGKSLTVIATPGHTLDHICYFGWLVGEIPVLFCGDTLFSAGCGRLFEGTAGQMYESLQRLAQLPESTKVYCAHEYTLDNLQFATQVDADNRALLQRFQEVRRLRAAGGVSLPSTLALELHTNPFLRCSQSAILESVQQESGVLKPLEPRVVFEKLRAWKDRF